MTPTWTILAAVFAMFAFGAVMIALFGTHFRGVRRLAGVRYLRMKGLDQAGLDLHAAAGAALEERIRLLDQHMEYRLLPDEATRTTSDATRTIWPSRSRLRSS